MINLMREILLVVAIVFKANRESSVACYAQPNLYFDKASQMSAPIGEIRCVRYHGRFWDSGMS